jgi:hypothetical protein
MLGWAKPRGFSSSRPSNIAAGRGQAELTGKQFHRISAWKMVQRRTRGAGIATGVCNHTFRGTGITAYLENGGTLEKARQMAAHASPAPRSSATVARTVSLLMKW